jgi:transcriptional regulator with XRE-family HTH domain
MNPGKTKAGLAELLGLEPPAVSKILNGTRQIKAREYTLMRRYFGLPVDGEGAVTSPLARTLRVENGERVSVMQEGDAIPYSARPVCQPALDTLFDFRHGAGRYEVFQVRQSAMEPDFLKGESVLLDLTDIVPSPSGDFVISDGFEPMIRHCAFLPNTKPPMVNISARSGIFQPQTLSLDEFRIIGRVVGKVKWV